MKQKLILIMLAILGTFFFNSCDLFKYEAYVTIGNIGNVPMRAAVEDNFVTLSKYSAHTWAIQLDSENEVVELYLYAEPITEDDYDEAYVIVYGDRDVQTWLTGWDYANGQGKLQKKKSQVIHGQAPKNLQAQ